MAVTGKVKKTLGDVIAHAIRNADDNYFWEDYHKQADAVLAAMSKEGYIFVRMTPTPEMINAGMETLKYGRQWKSDVVARMYHSMIEQSLKQPI